MKKFIALVLVAVMVLSFASTSLAAASVKPSGGKTGGESKIQIYNSEDKMIAKAPVTRISVGRANKLADADKEAFLAAYEAAKNDTAKKTKYFFWLDIPESYKTMEGFAYAKYPFRCTGENVQLTVNGKPMEVVNVRGANYFAKLTEFGTIAITCD